MSYKKWFKNNTINLQGKRVAITGATGGLGVQLCFHLAKLGADLLILNRSYEKSIELIERLHDKFPSVNVDFIPLDLENLNSVKRAITKLESIDIYAFIHNAGAYSIPRHKTDVGVDNVFQINFLSPFYMNYMLIDHFKKIGCRVVIVGSVAHNYSKSDLNDIDFSNVTVASKVYGNAKRFVMFSSYELFIKNNIQFSIVHPGITFTNITAHYPKLVFAVIKHPMKVIFMHPKKASLCILKGVFENCNHGEWIGPSIFGVWGFPVKSKLKSFDKNEAERMYSSAMNLIGKI